MPELLNVSQMSNTPAKVEATPALKMKQEGRIGTPRASREFAHSEMSQSMVSLGSEAMSNFGMGED